MRGRPVTFTPFFSPLPGVVLELPSGLQRVVITTHRDDIDWRRPDDPPGKVRTCTKQSWAEWCSRYKPKVVDEGRK